MAEQKTYIGKKGWERVRVIPFGMQRKIVANMTMESWRTIPHTAGIYEPDATEFWNTFQRLRTQPGWEGVTINTLMLYVITQALIACPAMNAHINFKPWTINGTIEEFKDVNISMPMALPTGDMMTINIHNCESKSLRELRDYISDVRRRMANTQLVEAMYEVALDNSMQELRRGRLLKVIGRLLGANIGQGKVKRLKGDAKKAYNAIPEADRLTKKDIEQGTIVVSNLGSVYRGNNYSVPCLIEIIPPQVAAIAIGGFTDRPGIVKDENGALTVAPRKYLSINSAVDHRACDFGDVMPFFKRLDEIFANPEQMKDWL
ncbi:MAG: 2-oxo acid dehydrogenase subunit E2 [Oscillospiraceae bacterium]|jgi:pyruvate dehydrogenase E2 component (dihydrolipoamide acetyltransferase)|nr:2-oxo acid dehydrogenase subunit E2 [Oscillospiraceae bacterium]